MQHTQKMTHNNIIVLFWMFYILHISSGQTGIWLKELGVQHVPQTYTPSEVQFLAPFKMQDSFEGHFKDDTLFMYQMNNIILISYLFFLSRNYSAI